MSLTHPDFSCDNGWDEVRDAFKSSFPVKNLKKTLASRMLLSVKYKCLQGVFAFLQLVTYCQFVDKSFFCRVLTQDDGRYITVEDVDAGH